MNKYAFERVFNQLLFCTYLNHYIFSYTWYSIELRCYEPVSSVCFFSVLRIHIYIIPKSTMSLTQYTRNRCSLPPIVHSFASPPKPIRIPDTSPLQADSLTPRPPTHATGFSTVASWIFCLCSWFRFSACYYTVCVCRSGPDFFFVFLSSYFISLSSYSRHL